MIRYALVCDEGHRFDSWFYDSAAFDEQSGRGLVSCPACDSHHVVKAIMAPAVVARRGDRRPGALVAHAPSESPPSESPPSEPPPPGSSPPEPASSPPAAVESSQSVDVALVDDERRRLVRAFRDKVLAETRDVGSAFATEARRIHDRENGGDGPVEKIRGQATLEEARDLLEDGIMVLPLPTLPDDLN